MILRTDLFTSRKLDADEDGIGGDDSADALRYLGALTYQRKPSKFSQQPSLCVTYC